jgi:hypothetical protein
MAIMSTEAGCEGTAWALPIDCSRGHVTWPLTKEELDGVFRSLEVPFDVNLVQWRVTEWSDDGARGLMMPYADPRAYSDRLNGLFSPLAGPAGIRCKPAHRFSAVSVDRRRKFWSPARQRSLVLHGRRVVG